MLYNGTIHLTFKTITVQSPNDRGPMDRSVNTLYTEDSVSEEGETKDGAAMEVVKVDRRPGNLHEPKRHC